MFDENAIAKELSDTFKNGLPKGADKEVVSKLIFNNIRAANKNFSSNNIEYNDEKKYFISRVIAYSTCEIYVKLCDNFKEKQLDRICKKSTNRICKILKQPLEEDSPENEIMTMVGFVLPMIITSESVIEKLRFNPVNIVKFILNIPKFVIKFINLLVQMRKMAQEYYKK